MANKNIKGCSSLIIREMQIKTMRYITSHLLMSERLKKKSKQMWVGMRNLSSSKNGTANTENSLEAS